MVTLSRKEEAGQTDISFLSTDIRLPQRNCKAENKGDIVRRLIYSAKGDIDRERKFGELVLENCKKYINSSVQLLLLIPHKKRTRISSYEKL